MNQAITSYLNDTYLYEFKHWPDTIHTQQEALARGLNCVSLAHLIDKSLFGIDLPESLRCIELFYENPYYTTVNSVQDLQIGDLMFVAAKGEQEKIDIFIPRYDEQGNLLNGSEFPHMHIAIYAGEKDEQVDPLFIHANWIDKKVSLWPLRKFREYPRYEEIYAIKRIKLDLSAPKPAFPKKLD